MLAFLSDFVHRYGYVAVALFVTLEGVGIPLPGETAVIAAAAYAAQGYLSIAGVILSATVGTVLGGSSGYWIGRAGGRDLLIRYGHLIRLSPERLLRTERYFDRHGAKTVFFARFVALLRIFGSLLAGVAHMPFPSFSMVNLTGGFLWAATFSALGYLFGKNLSVLDDYVTEISLAVLVVLVIAALVYWRRARRTA